MSALSTWSLSDMQSVWELARAARNIWATRDDDKNGALAEVEGKLEAMMFGAPAVTVSDVSVKLWLVKEAFDAQWSDGDVKLVLRQIDDAFRHMARRAGQ